MQISENNEQENPRLHHMLLKTSQKNQNQIKQALGTIQNSPKIHLQRNKKLALDFSTTLNSKMTKGHRN